MNENGNEEKGDGKGKGKGKELELQALRGSGVGGQEAPKKFLFIIRHAESEYNSYKFSCAAFFTCRCCCMLCKHCDPRIHDAQITNKGQTQALKLGEYLASTPKHKFSSLGKDDSRVLNNPDASSIGKGNGKVDSLDSLLSLIQVIYVSPLQRALQTATNIFIETHLSENKNNNNNNNEVMIPSIISIPFLSERVHTLSDCGSDKILLKKKFPHIDFSHPLFSFNKHLWWYPHVNYLEFQDNLMKEYTRVEQRNNDKEKEVIPPIPVIGTIGSIGPRSTSDSSVTNQAVDSEEKSITRDYIVHEEPHEHLKKRIELFKLLIKESNHKYIAVVGHSMFFKHVFNQATKLGNCSMIIVECSEDKSSGELSFTICS